jgi:glycosyl hydrolase family 18 (putative chitinase)
MQSALTRSRLTPTLGFAAACLFIAAGQAAALELVGYVPNYRMTSTNYVNNILPRQLELLDEVRYFGITVNSNGSGALTTNATHLANIQKLKSLIDAIPEPNRPRLDITLGGWQTSDGFATIAGDAAKRDALAQNIAALLDQTGATAVDLDWEHPVGGTQLNNYATTLQRIKQEVGSDRRVYGTVEPTKFLPASVFAGPNAIDGTSLMTYDLGWWANDGADTNRGEHALPQYAADSLSAWTDPPGTSNKRPYVFASWGKGLPTDRLGIGLPFYGRTIGTSQAPQSGNAVSYADLATGGQSSPLGENYFTYQGQTYWVPGPSEVADRVELAVEKGLHNIIIWELFHDLDPSHQDSLLRTAFDTRQSLLAVPGDFDSNGNVDSADYDIWRETFGSQAELQADGNDDGIVDAADYVVWRRQMSSAAGAVAIHAVPEPLTPWSLFAIIPLINAPRALNRKRSILALDFRHGESTTPPSTLDLS